MFLKISFHLKENVKESVCKKATLCARMLKTTTIIVKIFVIFYLIFLGSNNNFSFNILNFIFALLMRRFSFV